MRIEQLTFTRFVAALAIVVFHDGMEVFPFYLPGVHTLFGSAASGVSYFFILSGFVMVVAYAKKADSGVSYGTFYAYRFARIYPAYFIALMMVAFLFLLSGRTVEIVSFLSSLFLLQSWIPGYAATLNVPGWSLSVEFFFYLSFPILFNFLYRPPGRQYGLLFMALALWILTQVLSIVGANVLSNDPVTHSVLYYHPFMHINEFILGNVAALLFLKRQEPSVYRNYDGLILFLFAVLMVFLVYNPALNIHNGLLAVFFVPLIVLLSYDTGGLKRLFVRPLFVLLGEISYGIYIYQKPVKFYLFKFYAIAGITQKELCFYGFVMVLILFSYGSYRFIEQPVRKFIHSRLKQRLASSPLT